MDEPPRKTRPQEVRDFGLRSSVGARLAGAFAVNVTQVMVSSNRLETEASIRIVQSLPRGGNAKNA